MRYPCRKTCPDRTPDCCCEKLEAWKFCKEQEKKARQRERLIRSYQHDAIRDSHKSIRRKHRVG